MFNQTVVQVDDLLWFTNDVETMPPDGPLCGFQNDECKTDGKLPPEMVAAVIPLLAVLVMTAVLVYAVVKLRSVSA
ncbi:hypothetical protein BV898_03067 [Hypsibius exemplaris]|uniref:Uncharacterized protein n=1 Tax=Hypsibius exemplaris TaxID=2072580 RepID=A0A1W0X6K4_HYPEX|nr:hypothetical protein BV898_03067 [Hypsibius exemplaris]